MVSDVGQQREVSTQEKEKNKEKELTMNVGGKRILPLLFRQRQNVLLYHLIGMIVEQDVDSSQLLQSNFNDLLARLLGFQVCFVCKGFATLGFHKSDRFVCILLL